MTVPLTLTEGTPTISTTEWSFPAGGTTLTAQTTAGRMSALLNMSNLVAGDEFQFKLYEASVAAGTQLPIWDCTIKGAHDSFFTPDLPVARGWNLTAKRIAGADRVIGFSIRQSTGDVNAASIAASAINLAALASDTRLSLGIMRANTAQAGAAQAITLDAGASATDDIYVGMLAILTGGTGAGNARRIVDYIGSTKVATLNEPWLGTSPDNTTTFVLMADADMPELPGRKAITGTLTATAFTTDLTETTTDHYKDCFITFATGTLARQVKKCTAYDGSTKTLTFASGFTGAPSNGDVFYVING
jgi:hypothetical protein